MSLYGTKASSKPPGPKPVWPFYFLSILAVLFAIGTCVVYWPKDIPDRDDLVKIGGKLRIFVIRDDISNSTAGSQLPIFTSAYMLFKDVEGEFRYPWTFPKYPKVRNSMGIWVEVLVEKDAIGGDEAALIWQLIEKNPYKEDHEQTVVLFEDLIEGQKKNGEIVIKTTITFVIAAIVLWLMGIGMGRWNRRKYPDFYA